MATLKEIKAEELQKMISDKLVTDAFTGTNFGARDNREVIADTLLKIAGDYSTGHTSIMVCQYLKLINKTKRGWTLTKIGRRYLFWSHTRDL